MSTKARTPRWSTPDTAGYDIYSAETGDIQPGERKKFVIIAWLAGTLMIVDRDYRGVIKVTLWNTTEEPFHVEKGDRIGQSMVDRSYKIFWKPVRGLHQEKTGRDPARFGMTGC